MGMETAAIASTWHSARTIVIICPFIGGHHDYMETYVLLVADMLLLYGTKAARRILIRVRIPTELHN